MCSVRGMALHGEGDGGGRRTELAMFAPALPAPAASGYNGGWSLLRQGRGMNHG